MQDNNNYNQKHTITIHLGGPKVHETTFGLKQNPWQTRLCLEFLGRTEYWFRC